MGIFWFFFSVAEPEPIFFGRSREQHFLRWLRPRLNLLGKQKKSLVLVKKLDIKGSLNGEIWSKIDLY